MKCWHKHAPRGQILKVSKLICWQIQLEKAIFALEWQAQNMSHANLTSQNGVLFADVQIMCVTITDFEFLCTKNLISLGLHVSPRTPRFTKGKPAESNAYDKYQFTSTVHT